MRFARPRIIPINENDRYAEHAEWMFIKLPERKSEPEPEKIEYDVLIVWGLGLLLCGALWAAVSVFCLHGEKW